MYNVKILCARLRQENKDILSGRDNRPYGDYFLIYCATLH